MAQDIYTAENMVSMLTDANAKDKDSNVYKLFKTFETTLRDIYTTSLVITQFRGVDEAKGDTLDLIGANYNICRGAMYDDMYRTYIKAAIAKAWCDGTYNNVLKMLAFIFNASVDNISLIEDYVNATGSATVTVGKVPTKELNSIGMSIQQYSDIVQSLLPVGVGLTEREYEGSFAFATGDEVETDVDTGFADDEQTTGGTLTGVIQS